MCGLDRDAAMIRIARIDLNINAGELFVGVNPLAALVAVEYLAQVARFPIIPSRSISHWRRGDAPLEGRFVILEDHK